MKYFASLVLGAGLLLGGCTAKDGDPGPAGAAGATGGAGGSGPVGQQLKGNVVGFVTAYSEFLELTNSQRAGFTVTLEGSSPAITATTDANGRYELPAVPNGTLNLLIQKAGYSSQRRLGIVHAGGTVPTYTGFTSVAQISGTTVPSLSVGLPTPTAIPFSFVLNNSRVDPINGKPGAIRVYFDTQPTVSAATATKSLLYDFEYSGINQQTISPAELGYPSGTRVYMVAHGDVPYGTIGYTDLATGRDVWTALNPQPSPVQSFIMP